MDSLWYTHIIQHCGSQESFGFGRVNLRKRLLPGGVRSETSRRCKRRH